ncbi:MAG: 2-dehydropantoate 2-reductase [Terricaulis sp.]
MTRIAVIGPGAIGGTIAAWLAQDDAYDITLCARTPFDTLEIETPAGKLTATPHVVTDPTQVTPADWVLVATKTYDAAVAARWFANLAHAETRIAILQNGVEHVARFAAYADPARLVPVVVDLPAERRAPGRIHQRRFGALLTPETADGAAFAALFANTKIEAATTPDFTTAMWRKLCVNCAGAVFALTMQPPRIAARDDIAELMRGLMRECIAVAAAEGAKIESSFPDSVIAGYRATMSDAINSMHADRIAGRPMELDARNGVIVRLGAKHGIAAPLNALMVTLLEASRG